MSNTKKTKQVNPDSERKKTLRLTLDKIEKDFGKGLVMRLGDKPQEKYEVVSTGSIGLNKALGINGLPYGRIVEIYGPESSGKTTLAIHIIKNAQKAGKTALIIDVEHAFDTDYAASIGVDIDNLFISQPDYGEQALEIAVRLADSGTVDLIVIDSVAALLPKAELEGEVGESKMGLHARLMSQTLRKIAAIAYKKKVLIVFINQLRDKIGIMFGSPETTTGGNALKFYASVRIDIRKIGVFKDGEEVIGNNIRAKVIKNKCAPPFRFAEFDIRYGEGIDKYGEALTKAVELGIIDQNGSWFSYKDDKLGQGKEPVRLLLKDNEELFSEIATKIVNNINQ